MSLRQRLDLVQRDHPQLSVVRQCTLLGISRSSVYYQRAPVRQEDLELMALLDRQYLQTPYFGSRKFTAWLRAQGHPVNRKRVRQLMRIMGAGVSG